MIFRSRIEPLKMIFVYGFCSKTKTKIPKFKIKIQLALLVSMTRLKDVDEYLIPDKKGYKHVLGESNLVTEELWSTIICKFTPRIKKKQEW